ncbi:MAG: hypothetical protein ACHQ4F_16290 [Candidatus Dormibacteria bacterium]
MLAAPPGQPPAILSGTAAYDPALRMVLLAGGEPFGATNNNGTWAWNGTTWRELDANVNQPPVGGGEMAWDPALQEMVLVTQVSPTDDSAQTWVWTENHWASRGGASFSANDFVLGYDASRGALLAFTCCGMLANGASAGTGTQIWRWDGTAWLEVATTLNAPAAIQFGLNWDSTTRSLLLYGQNTFGSQIKGSLEPTFAWRLVGHQWTQVRALSSPQVLDGSIIDSANGARLVGSTPFVGNSTPFHIWAWTGVGWKLLG